MTSNEYTKAFTKSFDDLSDRLQRRDLLNAEIAGLRETVRVLANRVTLTETERDAVARVLAMVDYATPTLTDSIRALLTKVHPKEMTAVEVRNALEESSFNFDEFSNSLSACHAALKRLHTDNKVESGAVRDGKTTYKAVLPKLEPSLVDILAGNLAGNLGNIVSNSFLIPGGSWGKIETPILDFGPSVGKIVKALEENEKKKK